MIDKDVVQAILNGVDLSNIIDPSVLVRCCTKRVEPTELTGLSLTLVAPDVAYFGKWLHLELCILVFTLPWGVLWGCSEISGLVPVMICKRCSSKDLSIFNTEMNLHFSGRQGLDMASVWAFPKVRVCLNCGLAEFDVPDRELRMLAEGLDWMRSSKSA